MRIKQENEKRKNEFSAMKIWILEKNRNKKTEKCSKNWKKNKRVKKDINRTFFLQ